MDPKDLVVGWYYATPALVVNQYKIGNCIDTWKVRYMEYHPTSNAPHWFWDHPTSNAPHWFWEETYGTLYFTEQHVLDRLREWNALDDLRFG